MATTSRRETFGRDALHLLILSSFAIAEPLLEVLRRNPEFFAAHRLAPSDLVGLPLLLTAAPAAVLVALVLAARLFGRAPARATRSLAVSALVALIALQMARRLGGWPSPAAFGFAAVAAAVAGVLYHRSLAVGTFVTWLSPGLLVFPAAFLLDGAVRSFVVPTDTTLGVEAPTPPNSPIVMVVFDQLPLASILDGNGGINAARYPGFSALAADATWFRRATTTADLTGWAMPAIVTGNFPRPDRSPTAQQYPGNLFTLLGSSYSFDVVEPITKLCPERLCGADREPFVARLTGTLTDLGVVYLHVVLPADLEGLLPSLTENWRDFFTAPTWKTRWGQARDRDRRASALAFIRSIDASRPDRTLYFLHVLLPHEPYIYLPSGQALDEDAPLTGLRPDGRWTVNEWLVAQVYQRHLLQVGYTDALLSQLVARLKEVGLYDRALLVVTADHGASFEPGMSFKGVSQRTAPGILSVPLFIKAPGQHEGVVSDRNVETIDILPTIADLLGMKPTWTPDGVSAVATDSPERRDKVAYCDGARRRFVIAPDELQARLDGVVRRKIDWFGLDSQDRHPLMGPHADLIGRSVADVRTGATETDLVITFDDSWRFSDVDLDGPEFPARLTGRVASTHPLDRLPLAVAVNGTIRATTWAEVTPDPLVRTWAALVTPEGFRTGDNEVEIFVVDEAESPALRRAPRSAGQPDGLNLALSIAGDMWNVEQTGFYEREPIAGDRSFRWTADTATVTTSLDPGRPPRSLRVGLVLTGPGEAFTVRLDDCVVFEGRLPPDPWYRTFSLDRCPTPGDRTTITLTSSTFVPGGGDDRELGVGVEALNLFRAPWPLAPADLPAESPEYRMTFASDVRETVTATGARRALLHVTNEGSRPWPSAADPGGAAGAVGVVVRWFPAGGRGAPVAEALVDLPHAVYPGDVVVVPVPMLPASPAAPLPPGDYDLRASLRQEPNGEFPDPENAPQLKITVPAPPAGR